MSVAEAASIGQVTDIAAALAGGVEALSGQQQVTFTQYRRVVLPLDGYVFWVRADLLAPAPPLNGVPLNAQGLGAPQVATAPAATVQATGSLHYSSVRRQEEDATYAVNRVVFTSEAEVEDLDAVSPTLMYVGEFEGVRFAFSQRGSFYRRAALHHYVGDAVYPQLATQLVDAPMALDPSRLVATNSLPVWLAMGLGFPAFPSMLVPDNQPPPYVAVHIPPSDTRVLQAYPAADGTGTRTQLAADRVRLTLYGLGNDEALDLVDGVLGYIGEDGDPLGLMNRPVVRDDRRGQSELSAVAQRKTVEFEVSYYQSRLVSMARQLILSCVPQFDITGLFTLDRSELDGADARG